MKMIKKKKKQTNWTDRNNEREIQRKLRSFEVWSRAGAQACEFCWLVFRAGAWACEFCCLSLGGQASCSHSLSEDSSLRGDLKWIRHIFYMVPVVSSPKLTLGLRWMDTLNQTNTAHFLQSKTHRIHVRYILYVYICVGLLLSRGVFSFALLVRDAVNYGCMLVWDACEKKKMHG